MAIKHQGRTYLQLSAQLVGHDEVLWGRWRRRTGYKEWLVDIFTQQDFNAVSTLRGGRRTAGNTC